MKELNAYLNASIANASLRQWYYFAVKIRHAIWLLSLSHALIALATTTALGDRQPLPDKPLHALVVGLFLGQASLVAVWWGLGLQRFGLSTLHAVIAMLYFALNAVIYFRIPIGSYYVTIAIVLSSLLFGSYISGFAGSLWMLRRHCIRLELNPAVETDVPVTMSTFALLFTVLGVSFAAIRNLERPGESLGGLVIGCGYILLTMSVVTISSLWAALGARRVVFRVVYAGAAIALVASVPWLVLGVKGQIFAIAYTASFVVVVSSLMVLRLCGLRLVPVAK